LGAVGAGGEADPTHNIYFKLATDPVSIAEFGSFVRKMVDLVQLQPQQAIDSSNFTTAIGFGGNVGGGECYTVWANAVLMMVLGASAPFSLRGRFHFTPTQLLLADSLTARVCTLTLLRRSKISRVGCVTLNFTSSPSIPSGRPHCLLSSPKSPSPF
jgi:hypothetical protein